MQTSNRRCINIRTGIWNKSKDVSLYTETKMLSFWRNFNHWLHWKLSLWQLPVQPVMKISSKWRHFRFSVWHTIYIYCMPYNETSLLLFHIYPANHLHDTRFAVFKCRSILHVPLSLGITMMTSSNGNISALLALCDGNHRSPVDSPLQRMVARSFGVFFDLRLNKQSRRR